MAQMTATPDLAATMQARADVVSQTQEKLATAEQIASVNATKEARLRSMEDAVEKARIRAEKSAGLLKNAYVGQKLEETENCKRVIESAEAEDDLAMRKADFESTTKRKDEIRANMSDEFSLIFDSFLDLGGMAITASGDRVTNVGSSAVSEIRKARGPVPFKRPKIGPAAQNAVPKKAEKPVDKLKRLRKERADLTEGSDHRARVDSLHAEAEKEYGTLTKMEEALLKANDDLDACTFELEKEAEEADESNRAQETTFNSSIDGAMEDEDLAQEDEVQDVDAIVMCGGNM